jgi:hypothetical protein
MNLAISKLHVGGDRQRVDLMSAISGRPLKTILGRVSPLATAIAACFMRETRRSSAREISDHAILALLAVLLLCLLIARPGFAQKAGSETITADQIDIGKLQARIQKYDQALSIVTQPARVHGENVECNAVCYYPSSSGPIALALRARKEMRTALHGKSASRRL